MKPFSLERAQAGDPIMIAPGYGTLEWRPAHFVGLSRDGSPVVQIESVVITTPDHLRMAPRKRIVWVVIQPSTDSYTKYKVDPHTYPCAQNGYPSYPIEISE